MTDQDLVKSCFSNPEESSSFPKTRLGRTNQLHSKTSNIASPLFCHKGTLQSLLAICFRLGSCFWQWRNVPSGFFSGTDVCWFSHQFHLRSLQRRYIYVQQVLRFPWTIFECADCAAETERKARGERKTAMRSFGMWATCNTKWHPGLPVPKTQLHSEGEPRNHVPNRVMETLLKSDLRVDIFKPRHNLHSPS